MDKAILYKAKRKDNGEWIEGYIFKLKGEERYFIFIGEFDTTGLFPNFVRYEIIPETICKYTGLTDMNNTKIWENDILQDVDDNMIMVVRWDNTEIRFVLDCYGKKSCFVETEDGYYENAVEFGVIDIYGFDGFNKPIDTISKVIGNIFDQNI